MFGMEKHKRNKIIIIIIITIINTEYHYNLYATHLQTLQENMDAIMLYRFTCSNETRHHNEKSKWNNLKLLTYLLARLVIGVLCLAKKNSERKEEKDK